MLDLAEIKSRINPTYADLHGTASNERKQLCNEIERLQAVAQHEKDVAEAYKAEADALRKDAERLDFLIKTQRIVFDDGDGEFFTYGHSSGRSGPVSKSPRGAIDSEMKGGE